LCGHDEETCWVELLHSAAGQVSAAAALLCSALLLLSIATPSIHLIMSSDLYQPQFNDDHDNNLLESYTATRELVINGYYNIKAEIESLKLESNEGKKEHEIMIAFNHNENIHKMQQGGVFYRYMNNNTRTPLYMWYERQSNETLGTIYINPITLRREIISSDQNGESCVLSIEQLTNIYCGKQNNLFSSIAADVDDSKCFSLVSHALTLNLEAEESSGALSWLQGLHFILESLGSTVILSDDPTDNIAMNRHNEEINKLNNKIEMNKKNHIPYSLLSPSTANLNSPSAINHLSYEEDSDTSLPDRCGYLTKLGGNRKNWKKRVFKLFEDVLRYYVPKEGEGPTSRAHKFAGAIYLPGAAMALVKPEVYNKSTLFSITPTQEKRVYTLEANNEAERSDWMKALEKYTSQPFNAEKKHKLLNERTSLTIQSPGNILAPHHHKRLSINSPSAAEHSPTSANSGISPHSFTNSLAPMSSSANVSLQGGLKKKGEKHNRWQLRFFRLYKSGQLEYYTTNQWASEPVTLKGTVSAIGGKVESFADTSSSNSNNSLNSSYSSIPPSSFSPSTVLTSPTSNNANLLTNNAALQFSFTPFRSNRCYLLEAENEADKHRWIESLNQFTSIEEERVSAGSILEGWLTKEAGSFSISSRWQDRYFILSPGWLRYYKDKNDLKKPSGEIQLTAECILSIESSANYKKENLFSLQPTQGKNVRKYVMYASDSATRDKWLETINAILMALR
jgi:hypothetical protein